MDYHVTKRWGDQYQARGRSAHNGLLVAYGATRFEAERNLRLLDLRTRRATVTRLFDVYGSGEQVRAAA